MQDKTNRRLSQANFEIMQHVWEKGEATVNDIHEAVNSRRESKIKRESVQVQVKRLEKYGWLKRRKVGKLFYYSALRGKEVATRDILNDVKDRIFGGSQAELIRCLFENSQVSAEELKRIDKFLQKYDK